MATPADPECTFRSICEGRDAPYLQGVVASLAIENTSTEITDEEAAELTATRCCPVKECQLSLGALFNYVTAAGNAAPLDAIEREVPSHCTWNDMPHEDLANAVLEAFSRLSEASSE